MNVHLLILYMNANLIIIIVGVAHNVAIGLWPL
jgi:hypothetical protein